MARPILHVAPSPSFMDFTAGVFEEAAPGRNVIAAVDFAPKKLHVPDGVGVEPIASGAEGLKRLDSLIAESGIVVFHSVTAAVAGALASAPSSTLRVWSGWGGEYYGSAVDRFAGQLGPQTRKLVRSTYRPTIWLARSRDALRYGPVLRAAARATDVFSAPIPDDLEVFRRRFTGFHGEYSQLNYVSVQDSLASAERAPGRDILVGNSATPTNNHIEQFEMLARQDLSGRRVIVPLSYGDLDYAALVVREGRRLLGGSFEPLTDFMPLDAYNDLLAECGIVVMGSQRQLGLGNILRAVWQGAHLVLDRRNPTVGYLRERGASVTLLEEVEKHGLPSEPLSSQAVAANRAFLDEYWGREAVLRNIRALVDLV